MHECRIFIHVNLLIFYCIIILIDMKSLVKVVAVSLISASAYAAAAPAPAVGSPI
jgi:hypothetical protein